MFIGEAKSILAACMGDKAVYAAPVRYYRQGWTRDLALALAPGLAALEGPAPMRLVASHLREIAKRRKPLSGAIPKNEIAGTCFGGAKFPIVFLDGAKAHLHFLREKIGKTLTSGKLSFSLRRYLQGQYENLTPGTRDSELMFCYALLCHAEQGGDPNLRDELIGALDDALTYMESHYMDSMWSEEKVLVVGCDWRDTMERELADKALLSNNAILYGVYRRMGWDSRAAKVKEKLLGRRTAAGVLADYPGQERPDALGLALAVLEGVAGQEEYQSVLDAWQSVSTPNGVTVHCRHNPLDAREAAIIERTDGVVVWPFIQGYTVLALCKMATASAEADKLWFSSHCADMARAEFAKMNRTGMAEWYDPATAAACGAPQQGWSAALYLLAYQAVNQLP